MQHSLKVLIFLAALLMAVVYYVYAEAINHQFVNIDDLNYVTDNRYVKGGIEAESVLWAFTTGHASNWHPLTWLSLMLDAELAGVNPQAFHFTNIVLHQLNVLLLFFLLLRMTKRLWPSLVVAALFGLHPLHVESVAWVSERKDVLSTFFMMLTLLAYVRYVSSKGRTAYLLTALFLALGLMAEPMLVTLPFVMLLLDFWPLRRPPFFPSDLNRDRMENFTSLILEKLPFFGLIVISSIVTLFIQQRGGAVASIEALPLLTRLTNSAVAYVGYLSKTVWPTELTFFYPYDADALTIVRVSGSIALLLAVTGATVLASRRMPWLPVGWLWFLGTLVPVIGIVQVGGQSMADRYTYIPHIGLFIAGVWLAAESAAKWRILKAVWPVAALGILGVLAWTTKAQVLTWRDDITLCEHALKVTKNNYLAHYSLGFALDAMGRMDEAITHYEAALKIKPNYANAYNNLGVALLNKEQIEEAITHYRAAIKAMPDHADAHNNLGSALKMKGEIEKAIVHFRTALKNKPNFATAHNNLGVALFEKGQIEDAITHYRAAIKAMPDHADAHNNLGVALIKINQFEGAEIHFTEALRIEPRHSRARVNLNTLFRLKTKLNKTNLRGSSVDNNQ